MKKTSSLIALLLGISLHAAELPAPWKHQDIGAAQVAGKAEQAGGVFSLQGTMDLWGEADGCHLAWQPAQGDVEIVARVVAIQNPGGVAHAKASLCLRDSLAPGSRGVTLCVTPTDGTQFLTRAVTDGKTARVPDAEGLVGVPKATFPCWLKLVRHGAEISAYESTDGKAWQLKGKTSLDLTASAVIGLAASSHKKDILTQASFDNVVISPGSGH